MSDKATVIGNIQGSRFGRHTSKPFGPIGADLRQLHIAHAHALLRCSAVNIYSSLYEKIMSGFTI